VRSHADYFLALFCNNQQKLAIVWSKLKNFLTSKLFLINLGLIVFAVFAIVFGTLFYLDAFTRFGQKLEVPDLVSEQVNIADIDEFLADKGISYEVMDSVYRTDLPQGTIFFQDPGPTAETGMYVKEGRKIKIRVATRFRMVEMPALAGKTSRRFAEQKLKNRGLIPVIEWESSAEGKEQVLKQKYLGKDVEPGQKVPVGSKIILVVAKGYDPNLINSLSLIGLTISEAESRLGAKGLNVQAICEDCMGDDQRAAAVIYRQSPGPVDVSNLEEGSTVTVWASLQPRD
jgi:eukaryotic-like serine/threonine-protein kinase